MKKTYATPATVATLVSAATLCTTSMKLDDDNKVGGSGALTRQQIWLEEEGE
ncbi:MAG: hypothetical protein J6M53_05670 [Bacteroidaceae bacterium]|nr:hypothetical protein [Bacteroidaceae bacterium]